MIATVFGLVTTMVRVTGAPSDVDTGAKTLLTVGRDKTNAASLAVLLALFAAGSAPPDTSTTLVKVPDPTTCTTTVMGE